LSLDDVGGTAVVEVDDESGDGDVASPEEELAGIPDVVVVAGFAGATLVVGELSLVATSTTSRDGCTTNGDDPIPLGYGATVAGGE
jgi:hypothetical protein